MSSWPGVGRGGSATSLSAVRAVITLAALLVATTVRSAPPDPPTVYAPATDAGWAARPPQLRAQYAAGIPADVDRFEFEVQSPPGMLFATQVLAVNRASSNTLVSWTAPAPPDAGLHWWRARSLDRDGGTSPWMEWMSFRIDDTIPPWPATLTLDAQDAGLLSFSCEAVSDPQSGIAAYHWMLGQLDAPDGGVGTIFSGPTSTGPARVLRFGAGRWSVGVHSHDGVSNSQTNSLVWVPVVVPPSGLGVPPPLLTTQSNGAPWPAPPYQNVNRVYFRVPAQSFDAGGYLVLQASPDSGTWGYLTESTSPTTNVFVSDGRYEYRYVAFSGADPTDYSAPVFVWVDATRPLATARVDGGLDGGEVRLAWPPALDVNATTTGSGVGAYRVVRTLGDASVDVARVLSTEPLEAVDVPPPGVWTWLVTSEDRALNLSGDAGRLTLAIAPPAPGAPVPDLLLTDGGLSLSWAWSLTDPTDFELDRLDEDGGVAAVLGWLAGTSTTDAPPEGRWTWVARAMVGGAVGPSSAPSAQVVVDLSAPIVSTPTATRESSRSVLVEWAANDALTSVTRASLAREVDGVVTSLGEVPVGVAFLDAPPDGELRYRVTVEDAVGHPVTSGWSTPVVLPGLRIAEVAATTARCGQQVSLELSAAGEAPVAWALVEGPEGASLEGGVLTWAPGNGDELGPRRFTVRASGPTSSDELSFDVTLDCTRVRLGVGLGCTSGGDMLLPWALLTLLVLVRARR